jgi:hypothetical protein
MTLGTSHLVEIIQLYGRYNHAIDSGDHGAYVGCFTAGGALVVNGSAIVGESELADFARSVGAKQMKHLSSNIVVEGSLDDDAREASVIGRADVLVVRADAGQLVIAAAGSYVDQIVFGDDRWRFAKRVYTAVPNTESRPEGRSGS